VFVIRGGKLNEICTLDSDKFEAFHKILSIFEKSESVVINNSIIKQQFNTATITCDISGLIGDNIKLHILNPKKYIKLLKTLIKKNKKITISDEYERFVLSNNEINIYCPKQIEKIGLLNTVSNVSGEITGIGDDIKIDKETRKIIKQLSSDSNFIDVLIHKGQMKGISIPETAIYKFDEFVNEDINESNCDFRLRVYTILEIDGESYNLSLGVDKTNTYWLQSTIDGGDVSIKVLENATRRDDLENMLI
jgi:hypothetical protein